LEPVHDMAGHNPDIIWNPDGVTQEERKALLGIKGATIWFTGLSGSGKSSIAAACERMLVTAGQPACLLDGDNLRYGLNKDLNFSPQDRHENVRRVSEVACLFSGAGLISLVPIISPYESDRKTARGIHEIAGLPFFEVFINTPIQVCEDRDPKGLYAKARAGELKNFTGIDDPYEPPKYPDLVIAPKDGPPFVVATEVLKLLDSYSAE
jgi:bifunctional enzyme CysN/CysC